MKMMKKLMAVALAGVMALTLLAGCGNPYALSVKEIMNYIEDENPVVLDYDAETDTEIRVTLKAAADTDAVTLAGLLNNAIIAEENQGLYETQILEQCHDALQERLATQNNEYVAASYVKVPAAESETLKKRMNPLVEGSLIGNSIPLSAVPAKDGSEGTISICIRKIGNTNYVFAVIRTPGV